MRPHSRRLVAEKFSGWAQRWHLALYHPGLGEIGEVFALCDGPIHGKQSRVKLEMIDVSATLGRLMPPGINVNNRCRRRPIPCARAQTTRLG